MKISKKKILLALGSISVVAPIATVISCGYSTPSEEQIKARAFLSADSTFDMIQEKWQMDVLKSKNFLTDLIEKDFSDTNQPLVKAFNFVIKKNIEKDATYLSQDIGEKISRNTKFKNLLKADETTFSKLVSWNLQGFNENGDIDVQNDIPNDAKAFIFENIDSLRKEVYDAAISFVYLSSNLNLSDYEKTNTIDQYEELSEVQKVINSSEFVLVNEAVKQHLFAKWTLSVKTSDNSDIDLIENEDSKMTLDEADKQLKIGSDLYKAAKVQDGYSKKLLRSDIFSTKYKDYVQYQGISSETKGKGVLEFDSKDEILKANSEAKWNGYIIDEKLATKDITFAKDAYKDLEASLTKVIGLMPISKNKKLTFKGTKFESGKAKDELIFRLSLDKSVLTQAINYFTKKDKPILVEITNEELRQNAIDHGFKFIKED